MPRQIVQIIYTDTAAGAPDPLPFGIVNIGSDTAAIHLGYAAFRVVFVAVASVAGDVSGGVVTIAGGDEDWILNAG